MTSQEVIELGRKITEPEFGLVFVHPIIYTLIFFAGVLSLILFTVVMEGRKGSIIKAITLLSCVFMVIIVVDSLKVYGKEHSTHKKNLIEWKEEIALPYIATLTPEKNEVAYIKIDPELASKTTNRNAPSTEVQKVALTVAYKYNGTLVTTTDWYETNMTLTDKEEPYIEFNRLSKYLGHGISSGIYNTKVYLPDSYKFTDIK